jgi:hypothetical protein
MEGMYLKRCAKVEATFLATLAPHTQMGLTALRLGMLVTRAYCDEGDPAY